MIVVKASTSSSPAGSSGCNAEAGDRQVHHKRRKGFPIIRACRALLTQYHSLQLRKCGRLLPAIWAASGGGDPAGTCRSCPDKELKKMMKKKKTAKFQSAIAAAPCPPTSSYPPELIADCIDFLKKSSVTQS